VTIGVVGKYMNLKDSYKSLNEALIHGGIANSASVDIHWINSEELDTNKILKELQKVNCIFLSPIFITKKSNKFLGIHKFNNLTNYTKKKIICLGGIKKNNLKKIKLLNTYGFSSVSLFRQNIKYISF